MEITEIFKIKDYKNLESISITDANVNLRTAGNPISGNTGGIDNRGYCKYKGSAWVQDNLGNILNWHYMESCSRKKEVIKYPTGKPNSRGYKEKRNHSQVPMGWASRWFGGSCRYVGCWARFIDETGSG
ncbi:hypothetical protein ACFO5T_13985 [Dokdonia genika]|uniref:Uncharacterized protein n=1 Tax=Dokdonia genika TaxID=308113 RepID=A0ABV9LBL6_9FLAO